MKKLVKKLFLIFGLIALLFVFNINKIQASESDIRMIVTNLGEDSSKQMNVNWHSKNLGTYLEYTISSDINYSNKITVVPECVSLPFADKESEYQCMARLDNLSANTEYIYRIVSSQLSKNFKFKTAGGPEFTFAHVTDMHSYFNASGTNNRITTANRVVNKLNETKKLDFVLASGDVTAYGTEYELWEALYGMDFVANMPFTITPGNHDYYNRQAKVVSISYFNSVTNNPKNGAKGVINSSYYFKYGNALFISLNSEEAAGDATLRQNQINWLNEITANNPADFIIAFTHRPFYTGDGDNAGQARDMRSYFQAIFDNTGVDLVLSGHNHVYARSYQIYDSQKVTEPGMGTTYLTGIQIGDRYKDLPGNKMPEIEIAHLGKDEDGGSLITVGKDKIEMSFVKANGTQLYNYVIHSKSKLINKSTIDSSVKAELNNTDKSKATITYNRMGAGLVKKIKVLDSNNNVITETLNPITNSVNLNNLEFKSAYLDVTVELYLRNSEIIKKNFSLYNEDLDFGKIENLRIEEGTRNVKLKWDSVLKPNMVDKFEIHVNGKLLKTIEKELTETLLDSVSPFKKNIIDFKALNSNNEVLYSKTLEFGEDADELYVVFNWQTMNIEEGKSVKLEYSIYPEQDVELEFQSSDESIATVDHLGNVTTLKEGKVIISVNVVKRWDVKSEIEINVIKAEEPVETPKPKKGCFASASILLPISILGFALLYRKRRYY